MKVLAEVRLPPDAAERIEIRSWYAPERMEQVIQVVMREEPELPTADRTPD